MKKLTIKDKILKVLKNSPVTFQGLCEGVNKYNKNTPHYPMSISWAAKHLLNSYRIHVHRGVYYMPEFALTEEIVDSLMKKRRISNLKQKIKNLKFAIKYFNDWKKTLTPEELELAKKLANLGYGKYDEAKKILAGKGLLGEKDWYNFWSYVNRQIILKSDLKKAQASLKKLV